MKKLLSLVLSILLVAVPAFAAKPSTSYTVNTGTTFGAQIDYSWLLNENTGTTVTSKGTATAIAGTLTAHGAGTPAWTTNDTGAPALTTDSNLAGTVNLASLVSLTGAFTIVIRIKWSTVTADTVQIGNSATSTGFGMYIDASNIYVGNTGATFVSAAKGTVTAGTWYQWVIKRSSGNTVTFYKNGTSLGTASLSGTIPVRAFFGLGDGGAPTLATIDYVIVADGYEATPTDVTAINADVWQFFCDPTCGGGGGSAVNPGRRRVQ